MPGILDGGIWFPSSLPWVSVFPGYSGEGGKDEKGRDLLSIPINGLPHKRFSWVLDPTVNKLFSTRFVLKKFK
jgi:hypothetical protein